MACFTAKKRKISWELDAVFCYYGIVEHVNGWPHKEKRRIKMFL